jgi:hypothetical protein
VPRGTQDGEGACWAFAYWTVTISRVAFQPLRLACQVLLLRFGLFRFRSPLLTEYSLFLRVLRCFSSPGSLHPPMYSAGSTWAYPHVGFPIRASVAQAVAHTSPRLFAVYHALLRLLTPRHPPYALSSFALRDTEKLKFSRYYSVGNVPACFHKRRVCDPQSLWNAFQLNCRPHIRYWDDNSPASRQAE